VIDSYNVKETNCRSWTGAGSLFYFVIIWKH